jgi:polyisoprenoid-binding protein YceI
MQRTSLLRPLAIALLGLPLAAAAAPISFDFKDPKGVNSIQFKTDAPLEAISGSGNGVTGTISFDPAAPEKTSGQIVLATKSITVPNGMMNEHLLGEGWLNADAFGEIIFKAASLKNVKKDGDNVTADITGSLTLHGVTKNLTVPVKLTYLPGKLEARSGGSMKGDLLVVRSTFDVSRSDFGIKPGQNEDKVSDAVTITLSLAGIAPKN